MERRLGTRIVIDEEKVLREEIYDLEEMYRLLDWFAEDSGMVKKDKFTYECRGDERDMSSLATFLYVYIRRMKWLTTNLKQWEWLENGVATEDLIAFSKEENMGVWE